MFLCIYIDVLMKVSTIGYTHENRPIFVVKFSTGGAPKKSILIDANIHAREWIAGATATWVQLPTQLIYKIRS